MNNGENSIAGWREPLVSVVIPCYNRKKYAVECIESLNGCRYKNYEAIVVDDASTDGTADEIENLFPGVTVLRNKKNTMAAGARNRGLAAAKGKYVLFLDCDNYLDPDFLTELVKVAEPDDRIGIVGPKMNYYGKPGVIWYAGADISLLTGKTKYTGLNEADTGAYNKIRPVGHVPNAFLVRKSAAEKIGGFDETYVMSYAESDFAERMRKAGYSIMFCPSAKTLHKIHFIGESGNPLRGFGIDAPRRAYYFSRNRVLYMKRHAPFPNFVFFLLFFYPLYTFAIAAMMIRYRNIPALLKHMEGAAAGYSIAFRRL